MLVRAASPVHAAGGMLVAVQLCHETRGEVSFAALTFFGPLPELR
ncbi:hypothetical protein [Nocardia brevicatena]|nr:hypothetical protein [Nocardia brevicatena]